MSKKLTCNFVLTSRGKQPWEPARPLVSTRLWERLFVNPGFINWNRFHGTGYIRFCFRFQSFIRIQCFQVFFGFQMFLKNRFFWSFGQFWSTKCTNHVLGVFLADFKILTDVGHTDKFLSTNLILNEIGWFTKKVWLGLITEFVILAVPIVSYPKLTIASLAVLPYEACPLSNFIQLSVPNWRVEAWENESVKNSTIHI